jgi:imidazolonepropionase-like amidohydrolase
MRFQLGDARALRRSAPLRVCGARALTFALLTAMALQTMFVAPTRAQQRTGIDTYAITNARIFTGAGGANSIIERGTVVMRDGLIVAVGANVSAPADARIIDGAGLNIYPGVIDANTSLGIPAPAATPPPTGGRGAALLLVQQQTPQSAPGAAPNSTQPVGLQPEITAADLVRAGGDQFDAAHNAGITAALTAPREGIFIGQSAFINLAGDTPQQMILRAPVAQHIGFRPLRTGGYPDSLMGVITSIRQAFLDTQRYIRAQAIYARNPRGLRRPEQDRSFVALTPVVERQMPVVFYAEREREINRALDIAQEFNLRAIIAGGLESWKVTDRLRATGTPVLLSLNFPRRTTAFAPDADPDELRVLRERVEAPKTAAKLAAAGVRFAFQDGGMTNLSDYLTNATRAVENGLARDEAIAALSLRAAEIFGLSDRLGTIEPGKIANLTITRGDIFDNRNRRIAYVFIDGRPVDLRPVTAAPAGAGIAAGTWRLQVNVGVGNPLAVTLTLRQEGENLSGSIAGDMGSAQIANASVGAGGDIKFTAPVQDEGQTKEATFAGNIRGNQMSGTVTIVGRNPGTFTGTRASAPPAAPANAPAAPSNAPPVAPADLSGAWSINIDVPGQPLTATLNLQAQGGSLSGTMTSSLGTSNISNGTINGNNFSFTMTVTFGGQTFDITATGTVNGNQISGVMASPQGNVPFSGTKP